MDFNGTKLDLTVEGFEHAALDFVPGECDMEQIYISTLAFFLLTGHISPRRRDQGRAFPQRPGAERDQYQLEEGQRVRHRHSVHW